MFRGGHHGGAAHESPTAAKKLHSILDQYNWTSVAACDGLVFELAGARQLPTVRTRSGSWAMPCGLPHENAPDVSDGFCSGWRWGESDQGDDSGVTGALNAGLDSGALRGVELGAEPFQETAVRAEDSFQIRRRACASGGTAATAGTTRKYYPSMAPKSDALPA